MTFVPLLNRSAFTFYSGTARAERIVEACARGGYAAAGLCDRDGLYTAVPFARAAEKAGLKPVIGTEITSPGKASPPLFALARTDEGYTRLCELVTRRNLHPGDFHRERSAAAATEGGHVALVASDPSLLRSLKEAGAEKESLFAGLSGRTERDEAARGAAEGLCLPIVAAPVNWFPDPEGYRTHRLLRAMKHKPPEAAPSAFIPSPKEAEERLVWNRRALDVAGDLAASCDVKLPLGEWLLPHPPLPGGTSEEKRLKDLAYRGLARRVADVSAVYLSRLERELEVILRMGFAGYFLVVEEIASFARARGIPNIGRGSGASSLVSYCLFLTHVDPVSEGLYFERFLNPDRRNPPDIDLDFSWRERDRVIEHVFETYGAEKTCMIATHNTFSVRSAFRETASAMGIPEEETGIIARSLPHTGFNHLAEALASRPEGRRLPLKERPWHDVLLEAARLDGLPRHLSVHCGGVVVSPVPLTRRLSLQRSARGIAITQCDMYDVEALGLIKIDILGNRSLGVLNDAVASIEDHTGARPPVFPPEKCCVDGATNALLSSGRTMGCFYVESPGMRLLLKRLKTKTFRDLTAVSSIIRPGVSESGMMGAYIARRLGEEPAVYAAPELEPILGETFGVMVYQEDVIRVAHEFVGLTLAEADLLRRAMSGKYRSKREMDSLTSAFYEKGRARGISDEILIELWRQIRSFAGYAFCKAHSASFAQLSYQVSYLKAHHPAEFFASLINNQGGFYGTSAYVEEARRCGLVILPPDVNSSEDDFAGKDGRLRCGFFTLRGVRRDTMDALYEERGEEPFRSLPDLASRLRGRITTKELETLVRAGACDSLGRHRGHLLWLVRNFAKEPGRMAEAERCFGRGLPPGVERLPDPGRIGEQSSKYHRRRAAGASLERARFLGTQPPEGPAMPLSLSELLIGEERALGYYVTAHPLTPLMAWAGQRGCLNAESVPDTPKGKQARVWGKVITWKRIPTKQKREMMAFATLEDPTGLTETVFFPKTYRHFGRVITSRVPVIADGVIDEDHGARTLTVNRAVALRAK